MKLLPTLSDERAKTDIEQVGLLYDDTPVYAYHYKNDPTPRIGLIAQDVEKRRPDAVVTLPSGLKAVRYDKATEHSRVLGILNASHQGEAPRMPHVRPASSTISIWWPRTMPILDQYDPTDPSFDPQALQKLLAANAQARANQAEQAGLVDANPSRPVPDPASFGILNGAPLGIDLSGSASPALAATVPLPPPDPRPAMPAAAPSPAVPLPRPDPRGAMASAPVPATALAPASAVPVQPTASPDDQPPVPDTSLLGRINTALSGMGDYINTHPTTLMALGGGLAGAPSWGTGISRGLTAAASALNVDFQRQMQANGIRQTYQTLVAKGVPAERGAAVNL